MYIIELNSQDKRGVRTPVKILRKEERWQLIENIFTEDEWKPEFSIHSKNRTFSECTYVRTLLNILDIAPKITSDLKTEPAAAHQLHGSPTEMADLCSSGSDRFGCAPECATLSVWDHMFQILCLCVCGSGRMPCLLNVMLFKLFWLRGAPQTSELGGEGTPQLAPQLALSTFHRKAQIKHR